MKYRIKYLFLILFDAALINLAVYVMLLLRFEGHILAQYKVAFVQLMPLITIITLLFLAGMKLYKRVWEYASIGEMIALIRATTSSMAIIVMIIYLFKLPPLPRSVYIGSWVFMNVFIGASRVWWRIFNFYTFEGKERDYQKVLVIGAGDAGVILLKEIENNPKLKKKVKGIIDDDPNKLGMILCNVPIVGNRRNIEHTVRELEIDEIIIAIPSASGETIRQLVEICRKTPAQLRILPGIYQSTRGLIKNLRDVQMEDLLRREPVQLNLAEISGYINYKTILITGAGGSIGSELCRQLAGLAPQKIVLLDSSENNLFDIENELRENYPGIDFYPELGDVKSIDRLESVFNRYRPSVVFHAAAYKHVPIIERHPEEAIENNILGTLNLATLSDRFTVETFIYISTDKAVNPTSIMGASKRIGELIIMDINKTSQTHFAAVRFGNVLGSRGSVIPTFMKQIEKGGPVTITHPEMKRYFMTIPEAVELVIQSGSIAKGGEVFILDMGEMVKIDDLARDLIYLAGYEVGKDIEIVYTGIRPGEKLYEELFTSNEQVAATCHERIHVSQEKTIIDSSEIESLLSLFGNSFNEQRYLDLVSLIHQLCPENKNRFSSQTRYLVWKAGLNTNGRKAMGD